MKLGPQGVEFTVLEKRIAEHVLYRAADHLIAGAHAPYRGPRWEATVDALMRLQSLRLEIRFAPTHKLPVAPGEEKTNGTS